MNVIISDPDSAISQKTKSFLEANGFSAEICTNGKDCQLKVYRGGIGCLVVDAETENYSGLMVLKFMRLNHPEVKVILTVPSKNYFEQIGLDQNDVKKLGAFAILFKPYKEEQILAALRGDHLDRWKKIQLNNDVSNDESIVNEKDELFTRIKLDACQSGNITIFDHYLRLGPGRFIKVLKKGDPFDYGRIEKYKNEKKIEYLYFKTTERAIYVNFMNELLEKMMTRKKSGSSQLFTSIKTLSEIYIEEVYVTGLKPSLVDEGKKICQNMYKLVLTDADISKQLRTFQEQEATIHNHFFMVSFFSSIICKNLEWASERTVETIAMGGLLHDIGKLKLPAAIRNLEESQIPDQYKEIFKQHPLFGYEMLSKSDLISSPVKQIVYQHHELVNGNGYPNALSSAKIYPLAKVVSLADGFVTLITSKKCTPIEGLKLMIPDRNETSKYDPAALKSLVMGLLK